MFSLWLTRSATLGIGCVPVKSLLVQFVLFLIFLLHLVEFGVWKITLVFLVVFLNRFSKVIEYFREQSSVIRSSLAYIIVSSSRRRDHEEDEEEEEELDLRLRKLSIEEDEDEEEGESSMNLSQEESKTSIHLNRQESTTESESSTSSLSPGTHQVFYHYKG